jgi:hypothetical protein
MLPPDTKLEGELVAPTFAYLPNGRIKVESKDEIKARLKRSPDRADALALAVYKPAHVTATYVSLPHKCRSRDCRCNGTGNFTSRW